MNFFRIFLISLILVTFQPAKAEELAILQGEVLTLERCIDIAIDKNPNIDLANNSWAG